MYMLFRKIIFIEACYEKYAKHVYELYGQKVHCVRKVTVHL
jgi:hypothetical protein